MSVGKKLRFEVFKRDRFTCQYCGAQSPDVVLHCDHIEPKSKGGEDTLLNLVTACQGCNSGKGARRIQDDKVVKLTRDQLTSLQDRREQITMMLEWSYELESVIDDEIGGFDSYWSRVTGMTLTNTGRRAARRLLSRFGLLDVLQAAKIAVENYEDIEVAFDKIGGICFNRRRDREAVEDDAD